MSRSNLIDLANQSDVKRITEFGKAAQGLHTKDIADAYDLTKAIAPKRHARGKSYIGTRKGVTSSGSTSTRREEHLAVAMFNRSSAGVPFVLPDGRTLEILDYQTPLKARQGDKKIGKLDLLGILDNEWKCVIELKVDGENGSRGDTPLRALLEGLAYCAIVDANSVEFNAEIQERFGYAASEASPVLMVMAPSSYWQSYVSNRRAGDWRQVVSDLASRVRVSVGVETVFASLVDSGFEMGLAGKPPRLLGSCTLDYPPGL